MGLMRSRAGYFVIFGFSHMTMNVREFAIDKLKSDPNATLNIPYSDANLWQKVVSSATICKTCDHMLEFSQTNHSSTYPIIVSRYDLDTKTEYTIEVGTVTIRNTYSDFQPLARVRPYMEYYICPEAGIVRFTIPIPDWRISG
jgi:hypothetical protein